jgi:hypothetical protein
MGEEECIQDFGGKARRKENHSEHFNAGGKIILKQILKWMEGYWINLA